MKAIIQFLLFLTVIACICHAGEQAAADKRGPYSGYVVDANAATEIAKTVMSLIMAPDDFHLKKTYDAVLKDGIWTVTVGEYKGRLSSPVVILIRQRTGSIISYADPNA